MDLVYVPTWISQVEHLWEEPRAAGFCERLGSFARVIMFDRRGAGLSDPVLGTPPLEDQMDDVLAVMDAAGSDRAAIFAQAEGGMMGALFAATHPSAHRTWCCSRRGRACSPPPTIRGGSRPSCANSLSPLVEHWGEGRFGALLAPTEAGNEDFIAWFAKLERLSASPGTAGRVVREMGFADVRDVLPTIRVPTLLMNRAEDEILEPGHTRYLAEHISGARHVELPGRETLAIFGDSDAVLDEIEEFITGARQERRRDRVLATVLFTDICDSTKHAAELGDKQWRELLRRHDDQSRRAIARLRGREVKATGDGFLATFDGPARGIQCARAVVEAVRPLGIEVRAGLHTGECEVIGDDVGGMAVHIGARVMGCAGPGEVLVSSTVKDLVVGSGIGFEERGAHELRGVPGEWRLFLVA